MPDVDMIRSAAAASFLRVSASGVAKAAVPFMHILREASALPVPTVTGHTRASDCKERQLYWALTLFLYPTLSTSVQAVSPLAPKILLSL